MNELMNISNNSIDILKKNSPKILLFGGIGLGVAALGATSFASFRASDIVRDLHRNPKSRDKKWIAKQYLTKVIPLYIPVAILEAGSVVCLVKSYDISAKRLAAATALAEVSVETLRIYRDKAREVLGKEKAEELDKEVRAQKEDIHEQLEAHGDPYCEIQWFKDELTGQEFLSTKEKIKEACLTLNLRLHSEMTMSVNDWIDILNDVSFSCNGGENYQLSHILNGDECGWEEGYPIYVTYETTSKTKAGMPCFKLEYSLPPKPNHRHIYY